jgi:hypothetical protein
MAADPTPSVEDVRSRLARMKQRAAQLGNPGTAEERRRLI